MSRLVAVALVVALAVPGGTGAFAQSRKDEPVRPTGRVLPDRAEVNLVLIDVLVRDRKGTPITGLTKDDFELVIDSSPAPISTFESYCGKVSAQPEPDKDQEPSVPQQEVETETSIPAAEPRYIVLFFDLNHLTKQGLARSIDAGLEYVRDMKRDVDRVMIVVMKGEPILISSFTGENDVLEKKLLDLKDDKEMLDLTYLEERLNKHDILSKPCDLPDGSCSRRMVVAHAYAKEEELRARRSIEALESLMPAFSPLPGRKSVIHFSETLRDEPGNQYYVLAGGIPAGEKVDLRGDLQDLHKAANAAGVSFYTVWAAGLGEGAGAGAADASIRISGADAGAQQASSVAGEAAAISLGATLALDTGGVALKRSNDLTKVFTALNEDLSCYYVLGYVNEGPGDGARHMIKLDVKGERYRLRHRPYFDDWSENQRLEMKFESALLAPEFFSQIPVTAEAYALAPKSKKTPLLFKVEFPLNQITLVPQGDGFLYGEAEVRATVWQESSKPCSFSRRVPLALEPGEQIGNRQVIYEAGCELNPGSYFLSAAVLDVATWTLGADEISLGVQRRRAGVVGDVVLWTSSGQDILVAGDAEAVGILDKGSGTGFVPRSTRRFGLREAGILYVVVCPPEASKEDELAAIQVKRSLFVGDLEVASFPAVSLADLNAVPGMDRSSGQPLPSDRCAGFFSPIPPGQLGSGGYVMEVQVDGIGAAPVIHRAAFALNEEVSSN